MEELDNILINKVKYLSKILEFYANPEIYDLNGSINIMHDKGFMAREALKQESDITDNIIGEIENVDMSEFDIESIHKVQEVINELKKLLNND